MTTTSVPTAKPQYPRVIRVMHEPQCACGECAFDDLVWHQEATDSLISDMRSLLKDTGCIELDKIAPDLWRPLRFAMEVTLDRYSSRHRHPPADPT